MIVRPQEMRVEKRVNMRGGNGTAVLEHFYAADAMPPKTRLAARIILEKGASIGMHKHTGESEIYYCVQGTGKVIEDDGTEKELRVGDATLTCTGGSHYLEGTSEEPCIIVAVVVLE